MLSRRSKGRRSLVSVQRMFVVLVVLIGLFVQYFIRTVLSGLGVPWIEDGLPFAVLDWLLSVINGPVYRLLGLIYDPWAPGSVAIVVLLLYYAILAVVVSALLDGFDRQWKIQKLVTSVSWPSWSPVPFSRIGSDAVTCPRRRTASGPVIRRPRTT